MTKDDIEALKACFMAADGVKALSAIRRITGYDKATNLRSGEREQCYALGRASVFDDIQKAIQPKKEGSHERRRDSISDEL